MRRRDILAGSATCAAGLWLFACSEGPSEASTLTRVRALGARVEVEGSPDLSSPAPGDSAQVHWLLRGPGTPQELSYVVQTCEAPARGAGVPVCEVPLGGPERGRGTDPVVSVSAPEGGEGVLLLVAAFCEEGSARLDPDTLRARCAGSDVLAEAATLYIEVGGDNRNPSIKRDARLWLGNEPWPESPPGECKGPSVSGSEPVDVRLLLPQDARESTADGAEELLVSHLATAGAFDSLFSVIERDAESLELTVAWNPAEDAPAQGEVRFDFVVRDQRGGTDWIERCAHVRGR